MKVPYYNRSVQQRTPVAATINNNVSPSDARLAGTIGEAAIFASKEYQKANLADSQNAMLELSDYANTAYSDPKTGVITKQQRNALGVADSFVGQLDTKKQEIASKLNNDHARKLFDEQYAPFKIQQQRQAMLYETGQIKAYENNVAEGTLTNLSNNLAKAQGDNALIASYTNDIKNQIDKMSDTNGWSDEYKQAMVQKYVYSANLRNAENEVAQNYVNFQLQNGEPSDIGGVTRTATPKGLVTAGNINLNNRPTVKNADGSISTVRSISINVDDKEVLIPTISDDGKLLSDSEAVALFEKTGRHLGMFDSVENANRYAENLHKQQEAKYLGNDPRGIRNNNPGNIAKSANNWQGQSGDDGTYVQFATPEHGIRALSKNLLSYQRQGFDTVDSIVSRWAPDGNEQNYAKFVSEKLGVKSGDKIDLNNIDTLNKFTSAIIEFENGKIPYSNTQMNQGVSSALGLFELQAPDKSATTPSGNIYASPVSRLTQSLAFSSLEPSDQARLLKQAHTLENASNAQFRTELDQKVKDYTAAYLNGKSFSSPPTESDFIKAYGAYEGGQRYKQFANTQHLGSDIAAVQQLPDQALDALLKNRLPTDVEGYAEQSKNAGTLAQAIDYVRKSRSADMISFAKNSGQQINDLDLSSPDNVVSSLSQRMGVAKTLGAQYGMQSYNVLTQNEAEQLGNVVKASNANQKMTILNSVYSASNGNFKDYNTVLNQIGMNNSSFSTAGEIISSGDKNDSVVINKHYISANETADRQQVAKYILTGRDARTGGTGDSKVKGVGVPSSDKTLDAFYSAVGQVYAGDPNGLTTAYNTALDYYVGKAVEQGKFEALQDIDTDLFSEAVKVSTGGVSTKYSTRIPWGMDESDFNQLVSNRYNVIAEANGWKTKSGININDPYGLTNQELSDRFLLESENTPTGLPSGRYYVKAGNGYLQDDNGPVVIDIFNAKKQITDIPE